MKETAMRKVLSGQDLIDAGASQGRWFAEALIVANRILDAGGTEADALAAAMAHAPAPTIPLLETGVLPLHVNIEAGTDEERANVEAVTRSMAELLRTPVVTAGAIMPDACPAGPPGTIPVGGVVASRGIHPGMHSADICCSVAISMLPGATPAALLDAVHAVTHFGPGGRPRGQQIRPDEALIRQFSQHPLLSDTVSLAIEHFGTQGDGNHFAFVGTIRSTGETALVTHHGSRGPGARLYGKGMKIAERYRREISPQTRPDNAWIPGESRDAESYFEALQLIRAWTRASHIAIHNRAAERLGATVSDRFWNEHNFVFRKADGLYYHGKGATPAFAGFAEDATDLTLIPLNMAEPVLIVRGRDAPHGLGFSPHGAGRNFSRSQHRRQQAGRSPDDILREETAGIDARFFCGVPDISELPSAYKSAAAVRAQIERFDLAEVVDEVLPYGCIMAGDWEVNAPWRKKPRRA
jgi:hypothetical protein